MKRLGKKLKAIFMVASIVATITPSVMAQESDSAKTSCIDFTTNVDLYSRYIWRGAQIGTNASIQPTVKMICKNFILNFIKFSLIQGQNPTFLKPTICSFIVQNQRIER